ncbi:MAG TPA: hypothetical protein VF627_01710 [Abditibacterium sp.]
MQHLSAKISLMLGAALSAPVLARSAMAQNDFSAPAGWTQSASAGDLILDKSDGCRLTVKRLVPLGGGLGRWFGTQVARDAARRGGGTAAGSVKAQGPALSVARSYGGAAGRQFVVYAGYPVGNQGRLFVVSGPNQATWCAVFRNWRRFNSCS